MVSSNKKHKEELQKNRKTGLKTKVTKSGKKQDAAAIAWEGFITISVVTTLFFWVLFPLYSFQLQIIFDQRDCKGATPDNPQGGGSDCPLPYNKVKPPYCPLGSTCKENVGEHDALPTRVIHWIEDKEVAAKQEFDKLHKAEQKIESKVEKLVDSMAPDLSLAGIEKWTEPVLKFFTHALQQIYEIIVGVAWIEVDKHVQQLKETTKAKSGSGSGSPRGRSLGAAKRASSMKGGVKEGSNMPTKSGWKKELSGISRNDYIMANDRAMEVLERSLDFTKNTNIGGQCDAYKKFTSGYDGKDAGGKSGGMSPLSWIAPKEFGWPYTYLFDASGQKTAYDPKSSVAPFKTPSKWVGAWMAKTQQRSWSTNRGIWSLFLSLFLPFIDEEMTQQEIQERLTKYIKALDTEIYKINELEKKVRRENKGKSTPRTQRIQRVKTNLTQIHDNFGAVKKKFNSLGKGKTADDRKKGAAGLLFDAMTAVNINPISGAPAAQPSNLLDWGFNVAKKLTKAACSKAGNVIPGISTERNCNSKDGKWKKGSSVDNVYLQFLAAATKPKALRSYSPFTVFWNFNKGDATYWTRYITTWFIPILVMILMFLAIGGGFWITAFSSLNRYSGFILPLLLGFGISLYNMFAQPTALFLYTTFGGIGGRSSSKQCPYDGGSYQLKRNMFTYMPLNLFLTLSIIITSLGTTLIKTNTGHPILGIVLTALFPAIIVLRLLAAVFMYLWSLT